MEYQHQSLAPCVRRCSKVSVYDATLISALAREFSRRRNPGERLTFSDGNEVAEVCNIFATVALSDERVKSSWLKQRLVVEGEEDLCVFGIVQMFLDGQPSWRAAPLVARIIVSNER